MISKKWYTEPKISLQSTFASLQNPMISLPVDHQKIITIFYQQNLFFDFYEKIIINYFYYLL